MLLRYSDLRNKEVINLKTGSRMGYICDLVIKLHEGRICAIVVPGPSMTDAMVAAGTWTTPRSSRTVIALPSRCTIECSRYRNVMRSLMRDSCPNVAGGVPGTGFMAPVPASSDRSHTPWPHRFLW